MNEENWLSILNNNYFHMRAKHNDFKVYQHKIFIFGFSYNPLWDVFCVNQQDVVYCELKRCLLCLPFLYLMWKVDHCSSKCDLINTSAKVSPIILWLKVLLLKNDICLKIMMWLCDIILHSITRTTKFWDNFSYFKMILCEI